MTDETAPAPEPPPNNAERLAAIVADAWAQSRRAVLDDETAANADARTEWLETLEREQLPTLERLFAQHLERTDLPDGLTALLENMVAPQHQSNVIAQIFGILGAALAFFPEAGAIELQNTMNSLRQSYTFVPVSPADLADAVIRGVLTQGAAEPEAAKSAVSPENFATLVDITGEPPGPIDMLKLKLRGDITDAELTHAIRYSRIRDEFIPAVKQLAYTQMSPADAIMAAIKEVVSLSDAQALFERGGGLAGDFDTLYQAAGDSIGIQQVLTLWKYGQTTEAEVNKALGRSRINPMFYALAKQTHFHPLSAFQIARAASAGTITPATAEDWLIKDGVPVDQAHALATAHSSGGTAKAHAETESMVTEAYSEQLLTHAEATTALTGIGYHADVAALLLDIADAKYALKAQATAVSVIRTGFTSHRISRNQASSDLDALHVPAAARDKWLADWDVEISAHPKTLTAVQLATAGKDGFLTPEVVYARIQQEGYTAGDAAVLMALHKAPLPAGVKV
jgi:hypothetical protein